MVAAWTCSKSFSFSGPILGLLGAASTKVVATRQSKRVCIMMFVVQEWHVTTTVIAKGWRR